MTSAGSRAPRTTQKISARNGGDTPEAWARFAKAHAAGEVIGVEYYQLTPEAAKKHTEDALERFWTAAKDRPGMRFEPADEKERTTVPLSLEHSAEVIRMGVVTGLAEHCGMEWKEAFFSFMKAQRTKRKLSEKQNTFMGVLHGFTQQDAFSRSGLLDCSTSLQDEIRALQAAYSAMPDQTADETESIGGLE